MGCDCNTAVSSSLHCVNYVSATLTTVSQPARSRGMDSCHFRSVFIHVANQHGHSRPIRADRPATDMWVTATFWGNSSADGVICGSIRSENTRMKTPTHMPIYNSRARLPIIRNVRPNPTSPIPISARRVRGEQWVHRASVRCNEQTQFC